MRKKNVFGLDVPNFKAGRKLVDRKMFTNDDPRKLDVFYERLNLFLSFFPPVPLVNCRENIFFKTFFFNYRI